MHHAINELRFHLGLTPKETEMEKGIRRLGGNFWGFPDGMDLLGEDQFLYFEIEEGQHHPSTNVLKYWPILEESPSIRIILVQWIRKKPKSPNRWKLAQFVGAKMMLEFPDRFQYVFLQNDDEENYVKLNELKRKIK
jgi:hypothetical protein